jgi:myosin-5
MLVPSSQWGPMIQNFVLNGLCSLILEKTINDPDKYQNGKTKIFFRAGMLAALETLRSDRLNAMVTVVQKNMRRHMCLKRYREMRTAAIRIQSWWRGILAKRFVAQVRRETAATRFQRVARRYVQRKRFTEVRAAVVRLQSRTYNMTTLLILIAQIPSRNSGCPGSSRIQGTTTCSCNYAVAEFLPWDVRQRALFNILY